MGQRFSPDQRRQINDLPPAEVLAKDNAGAERLTDGNPLVCEDAPGRVFAITSRS
jgi:hypothetical protein